MVFIVLMLLSVPAKGTWQVLGDTFENADRQDLIIYNGTPYVVYQEGSSGINDINVYFFNGSNWDQLGTTLNSDLNNRGAHPSMIMPNGTPIVAWSEYYPSTSNYRVIVKHYNGISWENYGSSLNVDPNESACYPRLTYFNGSPYVFWHEGSGTFYQARVKRWNGTDWELGFSLNADPSHTVWWIEYPIDAISSPSNLYVTWLEENASGIYQVMVKRYNGASWDQIGYSLNVDPSLNAHHPRMAIENDTPYISWTERYHLFHHPSYVKYWNGASWTQVGGPVFDYLATSCNNKSEIAIWNGTPYVISNEFAHYMYHYTGSQWVRDNGSVSGYLNNQPEARLAFYNGVPYICNDTGTDIFVARYLTATQTTTQTATPTISPTPTITPTVTLSSTKTPTFSTTPTQTHTPTIPIHLNCQKRPHQLPHLQAQ